MSVEDKIDKVLQGDVAWVKRHEANFEKQSDKINHLQVMLGRHEAQLKRLDDDLSSLGDKIRRFLDDYHSKQTSSVKEFLGQFEFFAVIIEHWKIIMLVLGGLAAGMTWLVRFLNKFP